MDFSGLRKKGRSDQEMINYVEVDNLIFCFDHYSALVCEEMFKHEMDFEIISDRKLDYHDLRLKGPSTFRAAGQEDKSEIQSVFYKDQKFRPFGGRSKPMELLEGEVFYSLPKQDFEPRKISNELISKINKKLHLKRLVKIEKTDLGFRIYCGDNTCFIVRNLFWPKGLSEFCRVLEDKSGLDEDFLNKVVNLSGVAPLYMDLFIRKEIDFNETVFLPVSLSHEHGHFIGDIKKLGEKKSQFSFVHFIDPNEIGEEHVSRLIKNLKRQIEKVFEVNKRDFIDEVISLTSIGVAREVDDTLSDQVHKIFPGLKLLGEQFLHESFFADSADVKQSGYRGYKSVDIAALSLGKSVDKNGRGLNTYN